MTSTEEIEGTLQMLCELGLGASDVGKLSVLDTEQKKAVLQTLKLMTAAIGKSVQTFLPSIPKGVEREKFTDHLISAAVDFGQDEAAAYVSSFSDVHSQDAPLLLLIGLRRVRLSALLAALKIIENSEIVVCPDELLQKKFKLDVSLSSQTA